MPDKKLILTITAEECGELTQACCKILRHDIDPKRIKDLLEEAGDVQCMIDLLIKNKFFTRKQIRDRVKIKQNKMRKRHGDFF